MAQLQAKGRVRVVDLRGRDLGPCDRVRAERLLNMGKARLVAEDPLTIQIAREVTLPDTTLRQGGPAVAPGTPLLLHICCGPCATYPVPHLRELGFAVQGWWYNPNIQPSAEYIQREESARAYAVRVDLALASGPYEPERYEAAVRGQTAHPARCRECYRLRLEETAREAQRRRIELFTTTLLVSPYQDQEALRQIGEEVAGRYGRRFYFENMRRGWATRGRLAREYGLYRQQYCGCRFSLAERQAALAQPAVPQEESD